MLCPVVGFQHLPEHFSLLLFPAWHSLEVPVLEDVHSGLPMYILPGTRSLAAGNL